MAEQDEREPTCQLPPPRRRPRGGAAPFACDRAAFVRMIKNVTGSSGLLSPCSEELNEGGWTEHN